MKLDRRYILAHRDMKHDMDEYLCSNLSKLTLADLQPYGVFLPTIPSLLPPHADEVEWTITKGALYVSNDGTVVELKEGEKSDLASTPRIAKLFFGGPGKETPGALVHDDGYRKVNEKRLNILHNETWVPPKHWWDSRFMDCMRLCKTSKTKTNVFYYFVRYCGQMAWDKHRK